MCLAARWNENMKNDLLNLTHCSFAGCIFGTLPPSFSEQLACVGRNAWIHLLALPLKALFTAFTVLERSQAKERKNAMVGTSRVSRLWVYKHNECVFLCVRVGVSTGVNTGPRLRQPQSFPLHLTLPSLKAEHPGFPELKKRVQPLTSSVRDGYEAAPSNAVLQMYSFLLCLRGSPGLGPVLGHARSDQATFKVHCGRLAGLRGL